MSFESKPPATGHGSTPKSPLATFLNAGSRWRASYWFITFVVGLGVATDLLVYSLVIPVLPFRLQQLGYTGVSGLVGWLLFAYSGGLVVATIPIAMLSERYNNRKIPLIGGLIGLVGSQIMLMEAPTYWVMALARALQGISSSMVWVVGLALLCDVTPKQYIGRQLGFAMFGLSFGTIIGPPVGGALYDAFGFRGPCIFGIALAVLDLIGRLFIIEPKDLPTFTEEPPTSTSDAPQSVDRAQLDTEKDSEKVVANEKVDQEVPTDTEHPRDLSLLQVIIRLGKSGRAVTALLLSAVFGLVFGTIEPGLPLHLQAVWGLNSGQVGVVFIAGLGPGLICTWFTLPLRVFKPCSPCIIASPVTGWATDKYGAEWVTLLCIVLSMPWWMLMIIQGKLAVFIVFFVFASKYFSTTTVALFSCLHPSVGLFNSGIVSPVTAELAAAASSIEGVGCKIPALNHYFEAYLPFRRACLWGVQSRIWNRIRRLVGPYLQLTTVPQDSLYSLQLVLLLEGRCVEFSLMMAFVNSYMGTLGLRPHPFARMDSYLLDRHGLFVTVLAFRGAFHRR
ncbi:hypothetical protein HGRIS_007416 [Hohenbuehelia grisea]|uniref:Major facilitator superfamily (MFS) profile domain-containing protein n=1 Tax=Hohenbuehelia grisea TaxID=104357 RepID=A0ABR3J573_9AGAR